MKVRNRFFTSAVALSLLAGLPAAASTALPMLAAEEKTSTITLNGAQKGVTYTAYQIFTGNFSAERLTDIAWGSGVKEADLKAALGLKADATAEDAAKAITEDTKIEARGKIFAARSGTGKAAETKDGNVQISGLATGYYLITETTGSGQTPETRAFVMQVVKADETVNLKNSSTPTSEKHVHENDTDAPNGMLRAGDKGYQDVADYNIGDTVPFVLKAANLPTYDSISTWKEYEIVFTDTMSNSLDLNKNSIKVYAVDNAENNIYGLTNDNLVDSSKYTLATQDHGLTVKVDLKANSDLCDKTLIVTFDATLNKDAFIGKPGSYGEGNYNSFTLSYTHDPNTGEKKDTDEDHTLVFTYQLDVTKKDGENSQPLSGAQFKLYKLGSNNAKQYCTFDKTGVPSFGADGETFTTGGDGKLSFAGLDEGTYYLEEVKAPDGYNKLTGDVKIVLTSAKLEGTRLNKDNVAEVYNNVTVAVDDGQAADGSSIDITNNKGTQLPSTGGMGTTLFYTVGGTLVAGALVLIVTNKRMKKEQD